MVVFRQFSRKHFSGMPDWTVLYTSECVIIKNSKTTEIYHFWVPQNAFNQTFGYPKIVFLVLNTDIQNHFWNQWTKLNPTLVLDLNVEHFKWIQQNVAVCWHTKIIIYSVIKCKSHFLQLLKIIPSYLIFKNYSKISGVTQHTCLVADWNI